MSPASLTTLNHLVRDVVRDNGKYHGLALSKISPPRLTLNIYLLFAWRNAWISIAVRLLRYEQRLRLVEPGETLAGYPDVVLRWNGRSCRHVELHYKINKVTSQRLHAGVCEFCEEKRGQNSGCRTESRCNSGILHQVQYQYRYSKRFIHHLKQIYFETPAYFIYIKKGIIVRGVLCYSW